MDACLNSRQGASNLSFSYSDSNKGSQPIHDEVPFGFPTNLLFILIPHLKHFFLVNTFLLFWVNFSYGVFITAGSFQVITTDLPKSLHLCNPSLHNQFGFRFFTIETYLCTYHIMWCISDFNVACANAQSIFIFLLNARAYKGAQNGHHALKNSLG